MLVVWLEQSNVLAACWLRPCTALWHCPSKLLPVQGDCGLMQVRQDQVIFRTQAMNHQFDMPYQLAATGATDHARDACLAQLPLHSGDILVAGSDGLWVSVL